MTVLEILGKIDSYILFFGVLLPILLFLNKRHEKTLEERIKNLELFRISGVEKDLEAMKAHTERVREERDKLRKGFQELQEQLKEKDTGSDKATRQLMNLLEELVELVFSYVPGHSIGRRMPQQLVRIEGPVGDFWRKRFKKEEWLDVDDDLSKNPLWKD